MWNPHYSRKTLQQQHTGDWKKRNITIFQNLVMDVQQVASKTKEDIDLCSRVFNNLT